MKLNSIIIFFLTFTFQFNPVKTFSQDTLTLSDAIRIGIESSFSIRIARNNIEIAKLNNTPGNAGYLPQFDLSANNSNSFQNRYQENADETSLDQKGYPTYSVNSGIQLSWTLFDGFAMFVRAERLDLLEQQSELNFRMAIEDAIADIAYTYYSIKQNQKLLIWFTEQMNLSKQRLVVAREKSKIGVGYELQELQAEVDFRADSTMMLMQQNSVVNLKSEMNRLLNRSPEFTFYVNENIPIPQAQKTDDVYKKITDQNPAIINARIQSQISELDLKDAKSFLYPTINISGAYNFYKTNTPEGITTLYRTVGPAIGIGAYITLFNGFNASRKIKTAKIAIENQNLSSEDIALKLQHSAFKLVNALNHALEMVKVEQKSVSLAQRNADAAWERYKLGAISDLELRESQNKLLDSRYRLVSAQMNAQSAEIDLLTLTGDIGEIFNQK